MILLDTNVLSEPMRPLPDRAVMSWLDACAPDAVYLSTITVAEMRFGIAVLPKGKRRDSLHAALRDMLDLDFAGRVWTFDLAASQHYGDIAASRRATGRPISAQDCQIAAIARANGAALSTRNVDDFTDCGIEIVNPWNGSTT